MNVKGPTKDLKPPIYSMWKCLLFFRKMTMQLEGQLLRLRTFDGSMNFFLDKFKLRALALIQKDYNRGHLMVPEYFSFHYKFKLGVQLPRFCYFFLFSSILIFIHFTTNLERELYIFSYSWLSNKEAGWNKHAGRGKSWKVNKRAGSNKRSEYGKNLKFNKRGGTN